MVGTKCSLDTINVNRNRKNFHPKNMYVVNMILLPSAYYVFILYQLLDHLESHVGFIAVLVNLPSL